jgi:hypothetical protein
MAPDHEKACVACRVSSRHGDLDGKESSHLGP